MKIESRNYRRLVSRIIVNLIYLLAIILWEEIKMSIVPTESWIYVLNLALAILALVAFKMFNTARGKLKKVASLLVELSDALEDARITNEELTRIVGKLKDIAGLYFSADELRDHLRAEKLKDIAGAE